MRTSLLNIQLTTLLAYCVAAFVGFVGFAAFAHAARAEVKTEEVTYRDGEVTHQGPGAEQARQVSREGRAQLIIRRAGKSASGYALRGFPRATARRQLQSST